MSKVKFTSRTLESAAKTLYLDEKTADVHFVFESNSQSDRVPAHKNLLMAASKALRKMFNGQWKDKDEVPIPYVLTADFKMFLQYFYLVEVELSMENVEGVMSLSHQYDIDACLNDCATLLEHSLTVDNACWTYRLALLYEHEKLKAECETFISLNTEDVLKSSGFLECDQETLSHILRIDSMNCSEVCVFNACMKWSEEAAKQDDESEEFVQNPLGNLLYDIRYGSMTLQEFNAICTVHGYLFTDEEQRGIIKLIKSKKTQWKLFKGTPRVNPWKKSDEHKCVGGSRSKCGAEQIEIMKFSTNETLLLNAIVCSDAYYKGDGSRSRSEYEDFENVTSKLTVFEIDPLGPDEVEPRVLYVNEKLELPINGKRYDEDENGDDNSVMRFPKPIIIKHGFKYEIHLKPDEEIRADAYTVSSTEVKIKGGIKLKFDEGIALNSEFGRGKKLISALKFAVV
ncbi:BTB/POZ domain-containing protein 3-like [Sitodiplosis mosellana]|uniref:BTB/POZ domain-containing protein 3-like n=1 Tax=Sitodiplosis mosellana TaxID=263140 RepID=UPI002443CD55|nr:BTB/POZ domain-containing protein 3-like [Sitodiplosis mosellana]